MNQDKDRDRKIAAILELNPDWAQVRRELHRRFSNQMDRAAWWNSPYEDNPGRTPAQDILTGKVKPIKDALGLNPKQSWSKTPLLHVRIK